MISPMAFVKAKTRIREDATIGIVFTSFFALGLLMSTLYPAQVNLQTILLGNMLAIGDSEIIQRVIISGVTLLVLFLGLLTTNLLGWQPEPAAEGLVNGPLTSLAIALLPFNHRGRRALALVLLLAVTLYGLAGLPTAPRAAAAPGGAPGPASRRWRARDRRRTLGGAAGRRASGSAG